MAGGGTLGGPYGEHARNLSWTFEHWEDIVSDLSVFHRVDDVNTLTIPRFLAFAVRLSAYAGALRSRFSQAQTAGTASPVGAPTAGVPSAGGGDTPPEILHQLKAQQFAARHAKLKDAPVDPSAIRWDDNEVFRELVS